MSALSNDLASLRIQRDDPPPPRRTGLVVGVAAAVLVVALVVFALRPVVEAKLFKTEVAVTEISSISPSQAAVDVTSTGYVIPQVVAKVGAKILGRVGKVNVREGDEVKAGDILFELDAADQRSAIASAQAGVASARARVQAQRAGLRESELQWERQQRLVAAGAGPAAAAEDLGARVASLQAQVKAAEAEVEAAQAEVTVASVTLKNLTIPAPIDGTVMNKPAQVGDVASPGVTLLELADFRSLLIETDVPEGRLHMVKANGPCEVVLDSLPSKRFRGAVAEVSPRMNRAKATATVKVKLVDHPERLRPEMSARVSFLQRELDDAQMKQPVKTIVPAAAIVDRGGAKVVFVLDQGKVKQVNVTVGPPVSGGFELKDGPAPGTRVVKDPPATLADGQSVKEKERSS